MLHPEQAAGGFLVVSFIFFGLLLHVSTDPNQNNSLVFTGYFHWK
jgi:hypothetical protein